MDSSSRDSKVNPIAVLDAEKESMATEEETLLLSTDQKEEKDQVKQKRTRKVQWSDTNGKKLVEIMEFIPSDVSDSDEEQSDSCFCIIM